MRMRRTAFIMALMTVFTVSLFAQNSRGRNYIKQNISEWGGCRNVAITDTGGDLALNGKNDYAYTSGSKQDATTTDTTTTEAAAPEKVKIDENDAESLVAAFEQYADQYAAIIDKLNAAKPGSSEFESASKEMTELSEELQATSEKCQKLAPNFTKEQKQRFLKAAMKFASASKKIKIDV